MNIMLKNNGGFPALLSDLFGPSLIDRDLLDVESALFPSRLGINVPTANIGETEKAYILELAAPGLQRDDFTVSLEDRVITISVEKEAEQEPVYSRREHSFRSFSRSFALPDNANEHSVDAKYENGVLRVSVPKQVETSSRAVQTIQVL